MLAWPRRLLARWLAIDWNNLEPADPTNLEQGPEDL